MTVRVCSGREDWVPCDVVHGVAVLVDQVDGDILQTRLTVVLDPVLVGVFPHGVTHGDTRGRDPTVDRRVPERRLGQRVGVGNRAVIVLLRVGRVVRRVPVRECRDLHRIHQLAEHREDVVARSPRPERKACGIRCGVTTNCTQRPWRLRIADRQEHTNEVDTGQEIVEEVVAVRVRRHRCNRIAVGIDCCCEWITVDKPHVDQRDRCSRHAGLTGVLHPVAVQVHPDQVAEADDRR